MIKSFRDDWLEEFFRNNITGKHIPADIVGALFRRLQMLDDASCEKDLRSPPGNHLQKLSPPLVGWHSIRVNRQWRLIFTIERESGEARNVYLDPHTYR